MTRRVAIILALTSLTACAPQQAAAWMPRLVVRGGVAQRRVDDAHERWDWRVEGGLAWRFDRPPAPPVPPASPKITAGSMAPAELACVDPAICAWERRARAAALSGSEGEGP